MLKINRTNIKYIHTNNDIDAMIRNHNAITVYELLNALYEIHRDKLKLPFIITQISYALKIVYKLFNDSIRNY